MDGGWAASGDTRGRHCGAPKVVLIGFQKMGNLGLGYLSAVLRADGFVVEVIDIESPHRGDPRGRPRRRPDPDRLLPHLPVLHPQDRGDDESVAERGDRRSLHHGRPLSDLELRRDAQGRAGPGQHRAVRGRNDPARTRPRPGRRPGVARDRRLGLSRPARRPRGQCSARPRPRSRRSALPGPRLRPNGHPWTEDHAAPGQPRLRANLFVLFDPHLLSHRTGQGRSVAPPRRGGARDAHAARGTGHQHLPVPGR